MTLRKTRNTLQGHPGQTHHTPALGKLLFQTQLEWPLQAPGLPTWSSPGTQCTGTPKAQAYTCFESLSVQCHMRVRRCGQVFKKES